MGGNLLTLVVVGDCFLQPQVASIVSVCLNPYLQHAWKLIPGGHHNSSHDRVWSASGKPSSDTTTHPGSPAAKKTALK